MNKHVLFCKAICLPRFRKNATGFTLLEILIALFIFTILSIMLVGALHTVINAQSGTEKSAERLRQTQIALLIMSRDIEQAANRPVLNSVGKEDSAFAGDKHEFTFTHLGIANPTGNSARSALQRTKYVWDDGTLSRITWDVLDQAPTSKSHSRNLLTAVPDAYFEYIDKDGKPHAAWPVEGQTNAPVPRAVRIYLTIKNWGKMSQLYVIPIQVTNTQQAPQGGSPSDNPSKSGPPVHE